MGLFEKFNKGLRKTRNSMSGAIDTMLHGKNEIDDDLYDELEEILIMGDVGMNTAAQRIFQKNINPNALSKIQETPKTQEVLKKQENNTSCKEKGVVVS